MLSIEFVYIVILTIVYVLPKQAHCHFNYNAFAVCPHSDYTSMFPQQSDPPPPTSIAGQMLLCAINSLFENIDAEMGRLRGRVAGAPTPAECAKLTSVLQALDIRHGECART